MSCQSCHTDGHTNGLLSDTLGDGSYGAPKRVPSLLGVAATGPWTWTGSMDRLEDQVRKSIATTMHGHEAGRRAGRRPDRVSRHAGAAVAAIVVSRGADDPAIARGSAVFQARKCASCHEPPEYTTPQKVDVGLVDEVGNREFNPPSLRAVSRRDAFFHDGRARSLREVFARRTPPARTRALAA